MKEHHDCVLSQHLLGHTLVGRHTSERASPKNVELVIGCMVPVVISCLFAKLNASQTSIDIPPSSTKLSTRYKRRLFAKMPEVSI